MTEPNQQLDPPLLPVDHPRVLVFVAYPQMGLLDLSGAQTVFWAATKAMAERGLPGYRLHTASLEGGLQQTAEGLVVASERLDDVMTQTVDTLIVPGAPDIIRSLPDHGPLITWLRRASHHARRTASVCSGTFLLASAGLLLLSPIMLVTALAIKLDSKGPVLFRQKRFGYNDNLIRVFKFRSMYVEQTDVNAECQTTRLDPRITRVGRIIRKTSIDELPQLFNVLLGNMSMVGPRPHATATKAAGIPFEEAVNEYSSRHRVKPGITGWAQINGYRGETDTLFKIQKRVEYDLEYIAKWSVWFDLYIVFMTVPAVLSTKEVY